MTKNEFSIVKGYNLVPEGHQIIAFFQPFFHIYNRSEALKTRLWNMEYSNTSEMH